MSIYFGSVMNVYSLQEIITVSHLENWASFLHNPNDHTRLKVTYLTSSLSAYKTKSKQHNTVILLDYKLIACPEF
jgi:hypothetical protein